jgi:hypothetical protein
MRARNAIDENTVLTPFQKFQGPSIAPSSLHPECRLA